LKTVQRLQSGRRKAKKKDKPIGGNYGYGNREGEEKLINRIKELRNRVAHGRISLQMLTNTLSAEGFRTRKETLFSKQQIHRIVSNL
jgi:DNA invertase Pin-like site-specific DNA recombinase